MPKMVPSKGGKFVSYILCCNSLVVRKICVRASFTGIHTVAILHCVLSSLLSYWPRLDASRLFVSFSAVSCRTLGSGLNGSGLLAYGYLLYMMAVYFTIASSVHYLQIMCSH